MKGYERHLRAAVLLERTRNFGRAAEAFGVSQPAFSVMISTLEKRLALPLFHRTTRVVEPTDYARAFLNEVARLFEALDATTRSIQDIGVLKRGKVVVSCLSSISARLMPLVLRHCWSRYPNVELVIQDDVATRCLAALKEDAVDMIVTAALSLPRQLESEALRQDPIHGVFPVGHRFGAMEKVPWRALDGESLVLLSTQSAMHGMIARALDQNGVGLKRRIEASHLITIQGMTAAGIGVSVLPRMALPQDDGQLTAARPLVEPELSRTVSVSWRRDRRITPAGAAFLESLRSVVGSVTAAEPTEWIAKNSPVPGTPTQGEAVQTE